MKWFIHKDNKNAGPFSEKDVLKMEPEFVWASSLPHWISFVDWKNSLSENPIKEEDNSKVYYINYNNVLNGPLSQFELLKEIKELGPNEYSKVNIININDDKFKPLFTTNLVNHLGVNLRKNPRIGVSIHSELIVHGQGFPTTIISLSSEGCGLILPMCLTLPSETPIMLSFNINERDIIFYVKPLARTSYGMSFLFTQGSAEAKHNLINFIRETLKESEAS